MNIFKKSQSYSKSKEFTTENLPYLYQSEYYNIAWGYVHHGFYIDAQGRKYDYQLSGNRNNVEKRINWNWAEYLNVPDRYHRIPYSGHATIKPLELFENLGNCIEYKPWFRSRQETPIIISNGMIEDMMESEYEESIGHCRTDSGVLSNSLLIYDNGTDLYKRILLSSYGAMATANQSVHAKNMISSMGVTRYGRQSF